MYNVETMSRTYNIVCRDCEVRLWIGQGNEGTEYIYKTDEALRLLQAFLYSHQRHKIEFGDSEHLQVDEYENLDPD